MALTEIEQVLIDALSLCSLKEENRVMIFLMLETEEHKLKMAQYIMENEQATEKELMTKAKQIITE